jgi:ribosomal protein S18 acetylase RimI-like enzyme
LSQFDPLDRRTAQLCRRRSPCRSWSRSIAQCSPSRLRLNGGRKNQSQLCSSAIFRLAPCWTRAPNGDSLRHSSAYRLVGFAVVQPLASASIIGQQTWIKPKQKWRSLDWQLLDEFGLLPDCGYLADLGVAASHRRQGIGAELVRLGCQQYPDKPMQCCCG